MASSSTESKSFKGVLSVMLSKEKDGLSLDSSLFRALRRQGESVATWYAPFLCRSTSLVGFWLVVTVEEADELTDSLISANLEYSVNLRASVTRVEGRIKMPSTADDRGFVWGAVGLIDSGKN